MEYIRNTQKFRVLEPSVITLGKFDGLHRGHELLMENLKNASANAGYKTIVFTFDIPPKNKVDKAEYKVLTTNSARHHVYGTGIIY